MGSMDGRNKWQSIFSFFVCGSGGNVRSGTQVQKNGVRRFWGVRPWGILMGQQRDAENTDASFEQWIASLCRATLFNVGEMAQVVGNIYFGFGRPSPSPLSLKRGARQSAATSSKVISTRAQTRADPLIIPIDGLAKTH